MTHNHINVAHRMVKARQDKGPAVVSDTSASQIAVSTPSVTSTPPPVTSSTTKIASSTTPVTTSSSTRTTAASTTARETSSDQPSVKATSTSTTSSSSSSSSSSSAASSDSSSASSTSSGASSVSSTATRTSLATTSTTARAVLGQSTVRTGTGTFSNIGGSTITADPINSSAPSSGLSTGAIVGSVAGGIIGVAILAFIVAFVLRRWRKRSVQDQFPDLHDYPDVGPSPFDTPTMAQRGHNAAPSIASGPGMVGYGAYNSATAGAADYGTTSAAGAALQERPQYVFGQDPNNQARDDVSDHAHGAYSSEPQPQAVYNPEAYGSYALYDNTAAAAGYQDATREYQGQQGYDQSQYNYVVDAAPPTPPAGAYQVQNNVSNSPSHSRGANTRSIVADDDVYGGI